ncbi:galactose oxidase [Hypoxylon fragiforme]|uniref:galactose oxidase n=1 Tax=Hypoxylon fragiforme TaxID=63214 RepID=UPI0020C73042|nr:galactose oxidase [Hypoxylon fragiforme]KAI2603802.1 galactose oxidase [Hypoxylon fragiforme]
MADNSRSPTASSNKSRTVRSQKIASPSTDGSDVNEASDRVNPPGRSHTPGHLASKSQGSSAANRRKPSEPSIRARSQSVVAKSAFAPPPPPPTQTPIPTLTLRRHGDYNNPVPTDPQAGSASNQDADARRPATMRSTSAIAGRTTTLSSASGGGPRKSSAPPRPRGPHVPFPPLQDPKTAPDVPAAPSSGMYWSRAPVSGASHTPLRAHTTTLLGSNVYVFGGCDSRACFNELYVLDADSFHWSSPHVSGDIPVPLRAMTCTAVGKKLVVFGGGDGPAYYNDVYVLDTVNFRWHRPRIVGDRVPSARRAHTACLYKNGIYMFGGGDGVRALNDIWRLDVTDVHKMSWKLVSGPSAPSSSGSGSTPVKDTSRPKARGYHTANMVGSKLIIYGGSDGGECFNDVWVYDVDTHVWKTVLIPVTFRRLSHTSTIVGSYLFIIGGHDGNEYSNDVLLLNLVTMTWDKRKVYGLPPSGRGYHGTILYDSRLLVVGGFDGSEVFSDVWILDLAVHAYYSQISHFSIEV